MRFGAYSGAKESGPDASDTLGSLWEHALATKEGTIRFGREHGE